MRPELTAAQKSSFCAAVDRYLAISSPYELEFIAAVLGTSEGAAAWRFCKGVRCPSCNRAIGNLDYFMSAVRQHGVPFLQTACHRHRSDVEPEVQISLVDHHIDVVCIGCGAEVGVMSCTKPNCGAYIYRHPGVGAVSGIRLTPEWYDRILVEIGVDRAKE